MATKGGNVVKSVEKQPHSTISMSDLVKMQAQARIIQEQRKKEKILTPIGKQKLSKTNNKVSSQSQSPKRVTIGNIKALPSHCQQGKNDKNTSMNKGEKKMVPPGSIGVYARMKDISKKKEQMSKSIDALMEPIQLNDFLLNQQMRSTEKQQANYLEEQSFHGDGGWRLGLMDETGDSENSDIYFSEEQEEDIDPKEIENDVADVANQLIHIEDHPNDQLGKDRNN